MGKGRNPQQYLSTEAMKALADRLAKKPGGIGTPPVVPKKTPAVDDIDGQTKALGAALADALITASDVPVTVLQPVVGALAAQLVALGVRQTEHVDPNAAHAPSWLVQGMREQSMKVPDQAAARSADARPAAARTTKAPAAPKRRRNTAVRR